MNRYSTFNPIKLIILYFKYVFQHMLKQERVKHHKQFRCYERILISH